MEKNEPWCSRCVDGKLSCLTCERFVVKNGRTKGGKQRYKCPACYRSRVIHPQPNGFGKQLDQQIVSLLKESCGMRGIGRILKISPATVIRSILRISDRLELPIDFKKGGTYQVDELHTFVGNKKRQICVIFSWDKECRQAMSLAVGTRSKLNLRKVIHPLLLADARSINTDKYSGYKGVVPKKIHTTIKRRNNHIERQNLNLRTHLKRLNRKTICYSKSVEMLSAVIKIYFWGRIKVLETIS